MRIIGMDIHRVAAEVVSLLDGEIVKLGRVQMLRDKLEEFARKVLTHDDHLVIEATGNAAAVAEVLSPHVDRVVIANPKQVHMIAHAKVKTDTIDATVLAKLYASGFLPEVWVPDPETLALRRQVTRRTQLVRQRSRMKNLIQSILHAHLIPPCPHGNLVGISGRKWLARQILPADERAAIERHLSLIDQINEVLTVVEADIALHALQDPTIRRLMTLPGLDMTVAASVAAAIGEFVASAIRSDLSPISVSIRAYGSPVRVRPIMDALRSRAAGTRVECWWKQLGPPPAHRVPCVPFTSGSPRVAGSISRPSRPRGSLR